VHHSTEQLDWVSGFRNHPFDGAIVAPPFFFLIAAGFDATFTGVLAVVQLVTGLFLHANVRWRWRPLHRIVITPEFHHWHHANETDAHNSNYSVFLPLWDIVFGTYYMPATNGRCATASTTRSHRPWPGSSRGRSSPCCRRSRCLPIPNARFAEACRRSVAPSGLSGRRPPGPVLDDPVAANRVTGRSQRRPHIDRVHHEQKSRQVSFGLRSRGSERSTSRWWLSCRRRDSATSPTNPHRDPHRDPH